MYAIRVLVNGKILIVKPSAKTQQIYNLDGTPATSANNLGLEPYQVIELAKQDESDWFSRNSWMIG